MRGGKIHSLPFALENKTTVQFLPKTFPSTKSPSGFENLLRFFWFLSLKLLEPHLSFFVLLNNLRLLYWLTLINHFIIFKSFFSPSPMADHSHSSQHISDNILNKFSASGMGFVKNLPVLIKHTFHALLAHSAWKYDSIWLFSHCQSPKPHEILTNQHF